MKKSSSVRRRVRSLHDVLGGVCDGSAPTTPSGLHDDTDSSTARTRSLAVAHFDKQSEEHRATRRLLADRVPSGIQRICYNESQGDRDAGIWRHRVSGNMPVVICNVPGVSLWTPERLIAEAGSLEIPVSFVNEELGHARTEKRLMRIDAYISELRRKRGHCKHVQRGDDGHDSISFTPYAKQVAEVFNLLPGTKGELRRVLFDERTTWVSEYMWIGAAGSVTGLHSDDETNVLMQLYGYKHVLLFPPSDRKYLYVNTRYDKGTICSSVDPYAKNALGTWPKLAETTPMQCVLAPGEQLLIPKFWWHRCECVGTDLSISVNCFGSTIVDLLREASQRAILDFAHHWLGWKRGNCVCCDPISGVHTLST